MKVQSLKRAMGISECFCRGATNHLVTILAVLEGWTIKIFQVLGVSGSNSTSSIQRRHRSIEITRKEYFLTFIVGHWILKLCRGGNSCWYVGDKIQFSKKLGKHGKIKVQGCRNGLGWRFSGPPIFHDYSSKMGLQTHQYLRTVKVESYQYL